MFKCAEILPIGNSLKNRWTSNCDENDEKSSSPMKFNIDSIDRFHQSTNRRISSRWQFLFECSIEAFFEENLQNHLWTQIEFQLNKITKKAKENCFTSALILILSLIYFSSVCRWMTNIWNELNRLASIDRMLWLNGSMNSVLIFIIDEFLLKQTKSFFLDSFIFISSIEFILSNRTNRFVKSLRLINSISFFDSIQTLIFNDQFLFNFVQNHRKTEIRSSSELVEMRFEQI